MAQVINDAFHRNNTAVAMAGILVSPNIPQDGQTFEMLLTCKVAASKALLCLLGLVMQHFHVLVQDPTVLGSEDGVVHGR